MKYLFMLLFLIATVTVGAAFNGDNDKYPPVPTELVSANDAIVNVELATAEYSQNITNEAENHLIFEAVVPYTEINLVATVNQRVRWQYSSSNDKSNKTTQPARVKQTLQKNRSCLELNC